MFLKSKFKKNYLTAICMSLVLLMVSTLGFLIETNIRQITPPTTDTWESYITRPSGSASENEPWIINNARELAYLINNFHMQMRI